MNVVSLFNGMNTGRQALENVGIKVNKYYSSEIKPYAIELTQHHFPDTIQVGDVTKWKEWDIDWKSIDLILSGSPCQDLSSAGKRAGINGNKSNLFFVFVEILEHIKSLNPNIFFLQENVGSASKLDVGIMSRALGLYPVRINSKLVTAQKRDRYYWSNIKTTQTMFDIVTDIPQPKDLEILLKDIIIDYNNLYLTDKQIKRGINKSKAQTYHTGIKMGSVNFPTNIEGKSKALTVVCILGGRETNHIGDKNGIRILNQIEMERLQGFPDGYTSILSRAKAGSLLGDGWTLPIIEHIFKYIKK
jgi:DNA-cytosine methyltransferase